MKYLTIEALMAAANCPAYPVRWAERFDAAMAEYDAQGCAICAPGYYDALAAEYGFATAYRDAYLTAADAIRENEPLARLLTLLSHVLRDREFVYADLKEFKAPTSPTGGRDLAYDMLTALALLSLVPHCHAVLTERGLPEETVRGVLGFVDGAVYDYGRRHDGAYGCNLLDWFQRSVDGKLFRIGRLEIELARFRSPARVFRNADGETVALADELRVHRSGFALGAKHYEDEEGAYEATVEETDDAWIGHPFLPNGYVSPETVTLPKETWTVALMRGNKIISLHIPPTGRLDADAVDETLEEARAFLKRYFPDFRYKGFYCGSWLLDPQLEEMLGAESNIARFGRRFQRIAVPSKGDAVFTFVFLKPDRRNVDVASLPENTRLERALKAHYLGGRAIYELHGYFLC